jgi:hypothetical protein
MHSARFDFVLQDGQEISAVRYVNPDGRAGGWVAVDAQIHRGAIIEAGAIVCPGAVVEAGELVKDGEVRT